jgi:hypothetical protein
MMRDDFLSSGIIYALVFMIGVIMMARVYIRATSSVRLLQATLDSAGCRPASPSMREKA